MIPAVTPPLRAPRDVLGDVLPEGAPLVVDVELRRRVARAVARAPRGARREGIESGRPLARARAHDPAGGERLRAGRRGGAAVQGDATADAVLFVGNLTPSRRHFVARWPGPRGARRRPSPHAEPAGGGPYFDLLRPVDGETAVARPRTRPRRPPPASRGLVHEREVRFDGEVVHAGFDGFRDRVVLADAERAARSPASRTSCAHGSSAPRAACPTGTGSGSRCAWTCCGVWPGTRARILLAPMATTCEHVNEIGTTGRPSRTPGARAAPGRAQRLSQPPALP